MPAGIISGASIHIWNGGITKQTKFVDTEPSTSTFSDAALIDNGEFIDQINGITIYQLNHDANQVTVQVTFGEIPCNQANPTVSITPTSQTGSAGDTLAYTVSVLNNDGTGCSSSTFDLASEVSPGWGASLNPATLTIGPGASSVSTVSVTSPINEQNGSYLIEVWATNQIDAVHNGYDAATYIVFTDTTSPDVTITDPTDGADLSSNTTISADVTDIGTVERVEFYIDGSLKYTDYSSPYGYTWKINKESKGAHNILVKGFDEAGNEGSDTIPVTKVSGGKGGGGKGGNGGCRGKSCK